MTVYCSHKCPASQLWLLQAWTSPLLPCWSSQGRVATKNLHQLSITLGLDPRSSIKQPTQSLEITLYHVNWPVNYLKSSHKIMDPLALPLYSRSFTEPSQIFVATMSQGGPCQGPCDTETLCGPGASECTCAVCWGECANSSTPKGSGCPSSASDWIFSASTYSSLSRGIRRLPRRLSRVWLSRPRICDKKRIGKKWSSARSWNTEGSSTDNSYKCHKQQ